MMVFLFVVSSLVILIVLLVWAYKSANNQSHFFKLNRVLKDQLDWVHGQVKVGDTGKCISRLSPIGKAMINNREFEVTSSSDYIEENSTVVVTMVSRNKIVVNLKKK